MPQSGDLTFLTGRIVVMSRGVSSLSCPTSLAQVSPQQHERYPRYPPLSSVYACRGPGVEAVVLTNGRSKPREMYRVAAARAVGTKPLHNTCKKDRLVEGGGGVGETGLWCGTVSDTAGKPGSMGVSFLKGYEFSTAKIFSEGFVVLWNGRHCVKLEQLTCTVGSRDLPVLSCSNTTKNFH